MEISGTLHLYSGPDEEMFFVFDDDVAERLYRDQRYQHDDKESRRVQVSVGGNRFIKRSTMSFSRKQREIKVSLCKRTTSAGMLSLSALYNWFVPRRGVHPSPLPILGTLRTARFDGQHVTELAIQEPIELVVPPGLGPRRRKPSKARRAWRQRRAIVERDLLKASRPSEKVAVALLGRTYREPRYCCLWRKGYYDSELSEIRQMGVIADIDIWDDEAKRVEKFVEVKAQKVMGVTRAPAFYLSQAEWEGYKISQRRKLPYQIWLFQYQTLDSFRTKQGLRLLIFNRIRKESLGPDGFQVHPPLGDAEMHRF